MLLMAIGAVVWQVVLLITGPRGGDPEQLKQLLMSCALIGIVTMLFKQNSDDDWAGQF